LNPAHDGAILPNLHLNGLKIANLTVLARISHEELTELLHLLKHQKRSKGPSGFQTGTQD
jgi:xylulose-5-phosphate/fructose-6-phosphate phosphoketolase